MSKKRNRVGLYYVIHNWDLYILLLPGILLTILFKYVPIYGIIIAFKDFKIFDGFWGSPWVGLKHFNRVFSDSYFYLVLWNSFIISVYKLVWIFPMPIILSILLNEVRNIYFKRTIQTVVYLPHFLSWAVVYGIFYALLSNDGPFNDILAMLGMKRIPFFVTPRVFRGVLVATDAWKSVGWGTIIYLAALTSIDPELYDSSKIDGANKFQQVIYITLPGIMSTVIVMLVLRLSSLLNAGFEQIFIMYNPTVYNVADVIDTYVYRTGLGRQEFSYASAVGLFNSVVSFILIILSNALARRYSGRSIW